MRRAHLGARFWEYQRERFPLAMYGPLVLVFTFSAAAYSRLLRDVPGFIPLPLYAVGVLTALVFFFSLRVLDEHKDAIGDRQYRSELPVPRGLISLAELRVIATTCVAAVVVLNAGVAPRLLWPCLAVAGWALLMTREFFVPEWLRRHPTLYMISHMLIMPMIDAYTTGLDWLVADAEPRTGLWFFLVVTFLNGTVLEVGRKVRAPEDEREGVDTYSRIWGTRGAAYVWLGVLVATAVCAVYAARAAGGGWGSAGLILLLLMFTGSPAVAYARNPLRVWAKRTDLAGGIWTLAMYLILGALPLLARGF